jgi:hypothetical protein
MRNLYWNFMYELLYRSYYLERQRRCDSFFSFFMTALPLIISAGGLSAFFIGEGHLVTGAILMITAQAISAIEHLLPFRKRLQALTYLADGLTQIIGQLEADWLQIDSMSDEAVKDLIIRYSKEAERLETLALGELIIPHRASTSGSAYDDAARYVSSLYTQTY